MIGPDSTTNLDDDSDELAVGTVLGSYRILELIGEGGMGWIYVAEHVRLGRRVALKVLRQQYAVHPVAVARFFAEARAVNQISHENIVEITDFFENPGGANYFIMELLRGQDVAHVLMREGALPVSRVVDIARQVASVLAAVHEAKIIHRDLKPDNVFLINRSGTSDFVKLLDFGVAKLSEQQGAYKTKTTAIGSIIGTPEYMSPEQAGGEEVDHRSDIYSLGVIMYEMLTGVSPFRGKSFGEILVKHMTLDPKPLASFENVPEPIPGAVEALVMSLLAKDRDQRPQTMTDVEESLQGILDYVSPLVEVRRAESIRIVRPPISSRNDQKAPSGAPAESIGREPTIAATSVALQVPPPRSRRKPWMGVGAAVIVVVAALVIGVAARDGGSRPTAPPIAE
ncbi:MAG: serine/threonine-protein kinase, partial [Kofleriaceae bacterium]